jgi:hypothetical protein
MRKNRIFYVLILITLVFTACSKDENTQYYQVLGTLSKTDDSTIVVSDDDERLLVNNSGSVSNLDSSDRIIAYFSMANVQKPQGIDYVIDIYNFTKVLFKPVIDLTEANADSIGNDELTVRDMWISKDYLNLNFEYYGNTGLHYINLVKPAQTQPSDTVQLELRHNDNSDAQSYLMNGFVSFDLKSLKDASADSVVLHVKAKEYNSRVYDKYLGYKY